MVVATELPVTHARRSMKTRMMVGIGLLATATLVAAGCTMRVSPYGVVVAPAPIYVSPTQQAPSPPPQVVLVQPPVTFAPDYYWSDGEVCFAPYGADYVYWSGGRWLICDGLMLGRFHAWRDHHPRWDREGRRH